MASHEEGGHSCPPLLPGEAVDRPCRTENGTMDDGRSVLGIVTTDGHFEAEPE